MQPTRLLKAWTRLVKFPLTCDESSSDSQMNETIKDKPKDQSNPCPPFPPETPSACFAACLEAEKIFYQSL